MVWGCITVATFTITNQSQARNAFARGIALDCATNRVPPVVVNVGYRPTEILAVYTNSKLFATNFAELMKWNAVFAQHRRSLFQVFRCDRNHDPRLRFIKKRCSCRCLSGRKINLSAKSLFRIETTFG